MINFAYVQFEDDGRKLPYIVPICDILKFKPKSADDFDRDKEYSVKWDRSSAGKLADIWPAKIKCLGATVDEVNLKSKELKLKKPIVMSKRLPESKSSECSSRRRSDKSSSTSRTECKPSSSKAAAKRSSKEERDLKAEADKRRRHSLEKPENSKAHSKSVGKSASSTVDEHRGKQEEKNSCRTPVSESTVKLIPAKRSSKEERDLKAEADKRRRHSLEKPDESKAHSKSVGKSAFFTVDGHRGKQEERDSCHTPVSESTVNLPVKTESSGSGKVRKKRSPVSSSSSSNDSDDSDSTFMPPEEVKSLLDKEALTQHQLKAALAKLEKQRKKTAELEAQLQ
ncbi:hypothetical protein KUF71_025857, partial [Frankliniella fusca]